jgi:hypothetical protein
MNDYNGFTGNQRNKAQAWLNGQWSAGTLERPCECVACGQTLGVIDAHAEDYSEPFEAGKTDQYHLCFICHMMVHCRFRNRPAWHKYRRALMAGAVFTAWTGRNFPRFKASFLDTWNPSIARMREAPVRDVLGEIDAG